ncbi:WD_REPEATS_REGION domain-containing protein [Psidium guajava]|nr:WD_REPEATS_REGION domain-containing protein [Psidium guajava]
MLRLGCPIRCLVSGARAVGQIGVFKLAHQGSAIHHYWAHGPWAFVKFLEPSNDEIGKSVSTTAFGAGECKPRLPPTSFFPTYFLSAKKSTTLPARRGLLQQYSRRGSDRLCEARRSKCPGGISDDPGDSRPRLIRRSVTHLRSISSFPDLASTADVHRT